MEGDIRMPMRSQPWPAGTHSSRPCSVCGKTWRPYAMSRLPCHARCLLTDAAAERVGRLWKYDPITSIQSIARDIGVPPAAIRATLHWRCGVRRR